MKNYSSVASAIFNSNTKEEALVNVISSLEKEERKGTLPRLLKNGVCVVGLVATGYLGYILYVNNLAYAQQEEFKEPGVMGFKPPVKEEAEEEC
jgi:hypothetical protein